MSDQKRAASSSLENTPKKARFAEGHEGEDEGDEGPWGSSLLPSSELGSGATDKALSEYSVEKSEWRDHTGSVQEFLDFVTWPEAGNDAFKVNYSNAAQNVVDFQSFIEQLARFELTTVRDKLGRTRENERIAWSSIPLSYDAGELTDASCDDLVFVWLEIKKINCNVMWANPSCFVRQLSVLLPLPTGTSQAIRTIESAFYREERRTDDGRLPSASVCRKIIDYYRSYGSEKHLSPYTSVVGPSGIGKSFAISQMARQHGIYVVYASLSPSGALPYPERSCIANKVPLNGDRSDMVFFWECYVISSLLEVEICRLVGITPAGFYNLQAMQRYQEYQKKFSDWVGNFSTTPSKDNRKITRHNKAITGLLKSQFGNSQEELRSWKVRLDNDGNNGSLEEPVSRKADVPDALICIDEARNLLDRFECLPFRSLREALRNRFRKRTSSTPPSLDHELGDFFAVVLDTSSRVANFSPPARADPSQKFVPPFDSRTQGLALFPPVYAIDTMDLFTAPGVAHFPDGSTDAVCHLFRYGRPLWGSRIEAGEGAYDICTLAGSKVSKGPSKMRALALLSFRLNFYIANDAIVESLVSDLLRYCVYISADRDLLRTTQPSEPVLAFAASQEMQSAENRLSILQSFAQSSFEGCINAGDLGEMVAAVLLLFASDKALFGPKDGVPGADLPRAVSLASFIEALLGQDTASELAICMDSDKDMGALWKRAHIFATHFVRLSSPPDETTIRRAFDRGCALFMPSNYPGCDVLIPIGNEDGAISCFIIQVKNRKYDIHSSKLRTETMSSLNDATRALNLSAPLGMTMALREKGEQGHSFSIVQPEVKVSKRKTTSGQRGYKWPVAGKPKKLWFLVTGLTDEIYPAIRVDTSKASEDTAPLLRRLLDCNAGTSLPDDSDRLYTGRLMPLEWRPDLASAQSASEMPPGKGPEAAEGERVEDEEEYKPNSGSESDPAPGPSGY